MAKIERSSEHRGDCTISVVTEQREDGTWNAVASINRDTGHAVEVIRVPMGEGPAATFQTEDEARSYAIEAAERWMALNLPGGQP
jgi:hypothetical protein